MPELPEVTTTVNGLKKVLPGLVILDVWTDLAVKNQTIKQFENTIKNDLFFKKFKKEIIGVKILKVERRAKNILIHLNNKKTILIHLKMTGHLIFGRYEKVISGKQQVVSWKPAKNERKELHDPYNRFIHAVFSFSKNNHLVFCDARKFGKVTIFPTEDINNKISGLDELGPEPLETKFTLDKFRERLDTKKNRKIKTILMDQSVISGIGNIYSDEMLWLSGVHPESKPGNVPLPQIKLLFKSMKEVLNKGIKLGGDSTSDYRNIDGGKGDFQGKHNAYQRKGEKCGKKRCSGVIIRKVINGRSAHFCSLHQKLF